ncbi:hypothetical protein TNCV_103411 [Trichonephila clavipes]|nr:hypothetical protein TNCV_103411 [Trichonephila clavipes]
MVVTEFSLIMKYFSTIDEHILLEEAKDNEAECYISVFSITLQVRTFVKTSRVSSANSPIAPQYSIAELEIRRIVILVYSFDISKSNPHKAQRE